MMRLTALIDTPVRTRLLHSLGQEKGKDMLQIVRAERRNVTLGTTDLCIMPYILLFFNAVSVRVFSMKTCICAGYCCLATI
jgi:hypothetical protein